MATKLVGSAAASAGEYKHGDVETGDVETGEGGVLVGTLTGAGKAVAGVGDVTKGVAKVLFPCLNGKKMRYLIIFVQVAAAGTGVGLAIWGGYVVIGPLLAATGAFGAADSLNILRYGTILERMQINTARDEEANRQQAEQIQKMAAENAAYTDLNRAHGDLNAQFGVLMTQHATDLKKQKDDLNAATKKMLLNTEVAFKKNEARFQKQIGLLKSWGAKFSDSAKLMEDLGRGQRDLLRESRILLVKRQGMAEAEEIQTKLFAESQQRIAASEKQLLDMVKLIGDSGKRKAFIEFVRASYPTVVEEFEKASGKLD